ncbi:MAG: hypothetical protein ABW007_13170 [Chitinophagaceae bacterium]
MKSQHINLAHNQVLQYSSYLTSAHIIHDVQRYDIAGRRIFEIGSKFYFENTGIRKRLQGTTLRIKRNCWKTSSITTYFSSGTT